jgi:transposase
VIALLKRQAKTLEGEIASMIDDDPLWATLAETFRAVKGVADRTVARLMADLPEIGLYSNKVVTKLVGLAPIADDSGKRNGNRHIRGGREAVRSILFLVADIARRFDASLAEFHQKYQSRKTKNGRPRRPRLQTPRSSQRKSTRRESAICKYNLTPQIVALPWFLIEHKTIERFTLVRLPVVAAAPRSAAGCRRINAVRWVE